MQRVINFSGGRTSAFMTIMNYRKGDIVLFCDTGREHPKTYKFINDFEAFEGIPVIRISFKESKNAFAKFIEHTRFKRLPDKLYRECTTELKVKTARRYLVGIGVKTYDNLIGFRYDEPQRVNKRKSHYKSVTDKFPLYEQKIGKQEVNEYWKSKLYNLEIPSILGNCDLCFMKGKNAIISILTLYPELADKWIEDEEKTTSGRTYIKGVTYRQLRNIAQNNLFKDYDLNEINPAFNCACTT